MDKKKRNKKQPPVSERHFGVILENIDSKLDLVLEGHQGLDKKIDKVDEKIGKVDEKLEDFRKEVGERFKEVNYKFDVVFDELRLIRNELKEKVGRDEFAFLEKRVMALEKSRK